MNSKQYISSTWFSAFTGFHAEEAADGNPSNFPDDDCLAETAWGRELVQSSEMMQIMSSSPIKRKDVPVLIDHAKKVANRLKSLVEKSEASYGMLFVS